jgi:L-threonylcarbamoyladenylate synthase
MGLSYRDHAPGVLLMTGETGLNAGPTCLPIDSPGAIEHAVKLLQRGQVVAFPTDTVYGLGAHARLSSAVARLYSVKERPHHLPIPVLLSDAGGMETVCTKVPPLAWRLAERFWPGGLSLVLARSQIIPAVVTAGGPTVAVRVPDHSRVRELCRRLGAPLAATSANRHGQAAPVTADEVRAALGGGVPLILDGGACRGGRASTVLDLTVSPAAILRSGPVTAAALREFVDLEVVAK